jgi:hypothetical protein
MGLTRRQWAILGGILLCGAGGAWSCVVWLLDPPTLSVKADLDCIWLMSGIEPTKTFQQTLRWWTGPWCYELVPYYRPMTSLLFWMEYQAFGPNGLRGFTLVHLLSHLTAVLLAARFLAALLDWQRAAIAMAIYTLGLTNLFALGCVQGALPIWKDSCDIWCSICYLSSLSLLLAHYRRGGGGYLAGSVLCFALALTFKEMAYTLPLAACLVAWHERRLTRSEWGKLALFFGVAALMLAYRFWALEGAGYRQGTNGAWLSRTAITLGGPFGLILVHGDFLPLSLLCAACGIGFACVRRQPPLAAALFLAAAILWILNAWYFRLSVTDLALRLMLPDAWYNTLYVGAFVFLLWRFLKNRDRGQVFGYGWVAVTQIPLMAMPVGDHGYYLISLGWAVWLTVALQDIVSLLSGWEPFRRLIETIGRRAAISRAG